jgi:hypothetical protein
MSGPFSATRMQAIAAQIHGLASEADEGGRYEILKALGELQCQLESPKDTFMRLYNMVCEPFLVFAEGDDFSRTAIRMTSPYSSRCIDDLPSTPPATLLILQCPSICN